MTPERRVLVMYGFKHFALARGCGFSLVGCNRASNTAGQTSGAMKKESGAPADSVKIDSATATRTALAKVPGGRIVKEELENEGGHLVYSFDIEQGTQPGIQEFQIDARDGSVVSVEHEGPAAEAAEAKQDSAVNR